MTYPETIEYLYKSAPLFQQVGGAAYKEGLFNTRELDRHFGHPHRRFRTIHVAGTNGKGSVSHTLAALLQAAGYRTGLYTSPHLMDFRERIRVNGEMIPEAAVVDFVERERAFFEPLHPSFFELTTALAFKFFAEEEVDVAVIEVGLGGRLDCTNIITPELSVITNISLDHTQFLGDTLEKIAAEKAGIIKEGVPVVIGEVLPRTRPVFESVARDRNAPVFFAEEENEIRNVALTETGTFRYDTCSMGEFDAELTGWCQPKNTATVLCAVKRLYSSFPNLKTSWETCSGAFSRVGKMTGLMGRWQKVSSRPAVILDTGHNIGGWQYLGRQLSAVHCKTLRIVFGMAADKDVDAVLGCLPVSAVYYFTKASVRRAMHEDELAGKAGAHGLRGLSYPDVVAAVNAAMDDADGEDMIYVGGSSFIVADYLTASADGSMKDTGGR